MIIESGHDLRQVLGSPERLIELTRICIVLMDEHLRLLDTIELDPDSDEPDILDSLEVIAGTISMDAPEARYVALVWATRRAMGENVDWLRELDDRIRAEPMLRQVRLIGQVVYAADGISATLPLCDFTLYPELRDLPRTVSVPGPHGEQCPCPVCAEERRILWGDEGDGFHDDRALYDDHAYDDRSYGDRSYGDRGSSDYPEADLRDFQRGHGFAGFPERRSPTFRARRPALYTPPRAADALPVDTAPRFDPFWKRWYPDPERAYKRWTQEEDDTLTSAHATGMSCFDISILLRRQPGAVASRLNRLGLSSRTRVPGEDAPVLPPPGALHAPSEPGDPDGPGDPGGPGARGTRDD